MWAWSLFGDFWKAQNFNDSAGLKWRLYLMCVTCIELEPGGYLSDRFMLTIFFHLYMFLGVICFNKNWSLVKTVFKYAPPTTWLFFIFTWWSWACPSVHQCDRWTPCEGSDCPWNSVDKSRLFINSWSLQIKQDK